MSGLLLRTGRLQEYNALGSVGRPVYSAAPQLRSLVKRMFGPQYADMLATPQINEAGDTIAWHGPAQGQFVVPWTAASEDERQEARVILQQAQVDLRRRAQEMLSTTSNNQDMEVFARLLPLTTHIPDESHIHLVDGRPVLTFWGFNRLNAPPEADIIASLPARAAAPVAAAAPAAAPIAAAAAAPVVAAAPWWSRWWWWLLLLALLLFLLWALRGCGVPLGPLSLPDVKAPEITAPNIPLPDGRLPDGRFPDLRVPPGSYLDGYGRVVMPDGTVATITPDGTLEPVTPGTEGDIIPPDAALDPTGENATGENGVDENAAGENTNGVDENANQPEVPPQPDANAENPAENPAENRGEDPNANRDNNRDNEAREVPPNTPPTMDPNAAKPDPNAGKPDPNAAKPDPNKPNPNALPLTPDALNKGNLDFLDGQWRSRTGLMDSQTGQPLEVEYKFDGGQGTASITRSNGTKCEAPVTASVRGGGLVLDQTADAVCPDGQVFGRSQVQCTPGSTGAAECRGVHPDGGGYFVEIVK